MDTVNWLCEYDNIAWWTPDSVYSTPKEEQAKLGSEWFCFKINDIWHAVYGKYYDYECGGRGAIRYLKVTLK